MAVAERAVWIGFFNSLFAGDSGYVCIATTKPPHSRDTFSEKFFEWPSENDKMYDYIERVASSCNVYFGVNLLSLPKRKKDNCIPQNLVWGDLDSCRPDRLEIPPQVVIESSPLRYQAVWTIDRKLDPLVAENYSKRLAYSYAQYGADLSGWDLTQLLRVPGTYNWKYEQANEVPEVKLLVHAEDVTISADFFEALEIPESVPVDDIVGVPMPEVDSLPDPSSVVYAYQDQLKQTAFARYYSEEPNEDWSKSLWRLINTCIEVGMTADETFAVVRSSKCNKYERDGRPETHLWREILKAEIQHKSIQAIIQDNRILALPQLLTAKEVDKAGSGIIADYKAWAESSTDAVPEFHELSCAILLSALMAAGIRLPTSNVTIVPNLWGLILGDSTLTRKTTSMQMAMEFLQTIDSELVVASDGSVEGVLTAISTRPNMVSIFYRDEITGFLDAIRRKEYMASMPEILTQLYDVPKFLTRRLRKETITLQSPVFIFFGGGIRDKTYGLVEEEYFLSGFLPRFLVVSGSTDLDRVRRTGPPNKENSERRQELHSTFHALHTMYSKTEIEIAVDDDTSFTIDREVTAELTPDAWERYGDMEAALIAAASDSPHSMMALPTFQRMAISLLKLATLLGAVRQEPSANNTITIEKRDILEAGYYIQRWGAHMVDLIRNSGFSKDESLIRQVYRTIEAHPGIMRSAIMQRHHLNARNMSDIEDTLEQRMMVQLQKRGRAKSYWPIGR